MASYGSDLIASTTSSGRIGWQPMAVLKQASTQQCCGRHRNAHSSEIGFRLSRFVFLSPARDDGGIDFCASVRSASEARGQIQLLYPNRQHRIVRGRRVGANHSDDDTGNGFEPALRALDLDQGRAGKQPAQLAVTSEIWAVGRWKRPPRR